MKHAAAILASLLLIWAQAMAIARPVAPPASAPQCDCCSGKPACCCIGQSSPAQTNQPAAPAPANPGSEQTLAALGFVTWTLPSSDYRQISSADSFGSSFRTVPIFTRHCALLI